MFIASRPFGQRIFILRSQGAFPPGFYLLREGWVYRPAPEAPPKKGNADGAEGIFGTCRMHVGYGPAPEPTVKRPCAILARSVGRATNTATSPDRLAARQAKFLSFGLRGLSPQAFTSFGRVGFIARRLRRPKRGMPTGPRAFLEPAGCAWATALHPDPP